MFADASALVAILIEEPDFPLYAEALRQSFGTMVTEFVTMETGLVLMRARGLRAEETFDKIERLYKHFAIERIPLTSAMILTALKASERYGKGRGHPAQLNMGDCLSYGAARTLGLPLLYKGNDFARTDIASALDS